MPTDNNESDPSASAGAGTEPLACVSCRARKLKCDRITPACSRCIKVSNDCVYPASRRKPTFKRRNVKELEARLGIALSPYKQRQPVALFDMVLTVFNQPKSKTISKMSIELQRTMPTMIVRTSRFSRTWTSATRRHMPRYPNHLESQRKPSLSPFSSLILSRQRKLQGPSSTMLS